MSCSREWSEAGAFPHPERGPMGGGPGEAPGRTADAATGQRGAATPPVPRGATLRGQAPRGSLGAIGTAAFLFLVTQSACPSSWQP